MHLVFGGGITKLGTAGRVIGGLRLSFGPGSGWWEDGGRHSVFFPISKGAHVGPGNNDRGALMRGLPPGRPLGRECRIRQKHTFVEVKEIPPFTPGRGRAANHLSYIAIPTVRRRGANISGGRIRSPCKLRGTQSTDRGSARVCLIGVHTPAWWRPSTSKDGRPAALCGVGFGCDHPRRFPPPPPGRRPGNSGPRQPGRVGRWG